MPDNGGLDPIISIPVSIDAALRILMLSKQIIIGGLSVYQWAWSLFVAGLAINVIQRFVAHVRHFAGLPAHEPTVSTDYLEGGSLSDLEDFGDGNGYVAGSVGSRKAAAREIYGKDF